MNILLNLSNADKDVKKLIYKKQSEYKSECDCNYSLTRTIVRMIKEKFINELKEVK